MSFYSWMYPVQEAGYKTEKEESKDYIEGVCLIMDNISTHLTSASVEV